MCNGDGVVVAPGRTVVVSRFVGAVEGVKNVVGGSVDGDDVGGVVETVLGVGDEAKDGACAECSGRLDGAALGRSSVRWDWLC